MFLEAGAGLKMSDDEVLLDLDVRQSLEVESGDSQILDKELISLVFPALYLQF